MRRPAFALAALVLAACGDGGPSSSTPPPACAAADALWVASDYTSSGVGALGPAGLVTSTVGRVDLGADPALAVSRGRAFYVARDLDAIFELDPRCGTPLRRYGAHVASHTGSSDPQDVGVASDGSLWVPLYDVASVLVIHPDGTTRSIDLSSYDVDGNPQAMGIAMVDTPAGEKAFVPLQRLTDSALYRSERASTMLRVDVASATVDAQVTLAGRNPFGMTVAGSTIWLADAGNFDAADEPLAGVERFDTSTLTTALIVSEPELGGSVAEVAVHGDCGAAIVADATPNVNATSLATFDAATDKVLLPAARSPLATPGFDLQGLTWLGGSLGVGERVRAASGYPIHTLAAAACALTAQPDRIFLPLPPVAVRPGT